MGLLIVFVSKTNSLLVLFKKKKPEFELKERNKF